MKPDWYDCHEPFPLFDKLSEENEDGSCVTVDDFIKNHGEDHECVLPSSQCYEVGMFGDKRNCGTFYMCSEDGSGNIIMKQYQCPDGWVYDKSSTTHEPCVRITQGGFYDKECKFRHDTNMTQWEPADSTQCTQVGLKAYNDPYLPMYDDDFIQCAYKKDGQTLGQIGPMVCHDPFVFDDNKKLCV